MYMYVTGLVTKVEKDVDTVGALKISKTKEKHLNVN